MTYASLTLARLGLSVGALIGVDELASTATELDLLRAAGVDVRLELLEHGPVFQNIERPTGRVQIALSPSDRLNPRSVPAAWASARGWFFGPVADELDDGWADVVHADAHVATGWQGLLRVVEAGEGVRRKAPMANDLVARTDLMGVSRDDLDADIELDELCRLLRPGAMLVLPAAGRGGLAMTAAASGAIDLRRWPGIPADALVDATGAGDVFLAAMLAARLEPRLIGGSADGHRDLRLAAAAASLVIERPGLYGVPDRAALRARVARTPSSG